MFGRRSITLRGVGTGVLILLVAILAWRDVPLTGSGLVSIAGSLISDTPGPFVELFDSTVRQTPFARGAALDERHTQAVARTAARVSELSTATEPQRIGAALATYTGLLDDVARAPCPGGATFYYLYTDYLSAYAFIAPYAWLYERFGLGATHVALGLVLGAWLGMLALFFVGRAISRTWLGGVLAVGAFFIAGSAFDIDLAHRAVLLNAFVPLWLAQILLSHGQAKWWQPADRTELLAGLLFGVYAVVGLFLPPIANKVNVLIVAGVILVAGAAFRRPRLLVRAALVFAVVGLFQSSYRDYTAQLLAPVSAVNSADNDDFLFLNVADYTFERPTHYGFPNGDFNYQVIPARDYYLQTVAQSSSVPAEVLQVHQVYKPWGDAYLSDMALRHPWTLADAWGKRLFDQLYFHQLLSFGLYGTAKELGTWIFFLGIGLVAVTLVTRPLRIAAWPPAAVVLWHVFGIQTFVAIAHTHALYERTGVWLLWCLLPSFGIAAGAALWGLARRVRLPRGPLRPRHVAPAVAIALALLVAVPLGVREARKEIHAVRLWYAIHVGTGLPEEVRRPQELLDEVEAIRGLGGNEPGTVSMYAAWALQAWVDRVVYYKRFTLPIDYAAETSFAQEQMKALYRRALQEAPDNPNFATYAEFIGVEEWPAIYRSALQRFPDHPYATMMAYRLLSVATTPDEKARYAAIYEEKVRTLLASTSRYRPGYRQLPRILDLPPAAVVARADDVEVRLEGGRRFSLAPGDAFNSDRVKVGLYVKVERGTLLMRLDVDDVQCSGTITMTAADPIHYRLLECDKLPPAHALRVVLTGGTEGATAILRDYYPMIENPRHFRAAR